MSLNPQNTTLSKPRINAKSLAQQHGQKAVAAFFWLTLVGGYYWYMQRNGLSAREAISQLLDFLSNGLYGPILYIIIYTLRPLVFGSTIIMTSAAGYIYGPVLGTLYAIIGGNLSASVAYFIGVYFGQGLLESSQAQTLIQRYTERIRRNSFETVLFLRFLLLPYDLISYVAGFLRIHWLGFTIATLIGGLPGTIAFTLFGSSLEGNFINGEATLNPWTLVTSAGLFVVSFGLSWYLKKREKKNKGAAG